MDEYELRACLRHVAAGRLDRRTFARTMLRLGLGGPLVAELLRSTGPARAQTRPAAAPARRRGGGDPT